MIAARRCGTRTLRKAKSTLTVSVMESSAPSSRERRHRRRAEQRQGHARHGQRQDRPGGVAQALAVGEQRRLEDQDRQKQHQDDLRVHRRLGQRVHEDEQQADQNQGDVVGHAHALRPDGDRRTYSQNEKELLEMLPQPSPQQ
jgi:hypothetical protein